VKKENAYLKRIKKVVIWEYNPDYGDDRVCICGHTYQNHFDFGLDVINPDLCDCVCGCEYFKENKYAKN
jgi:hypothetical protein